MKFIKHIIFVVILVWIDQILKTCVRVFIPLHDRIEIIPGFFDLTYYQNRGAGFSILQGQMTFFYIVTIVALCFLGYLYYTTNKAHKFEIFCILLMVGGTIGNFIDRLRFQYVVDFLSFDIFGYAFPVFNFADICLTVGVFLYLILYLWEMKNGRA